MNIVGEVCTFLNRTIPSTDRTLQDITALGTKISINPWPLAPIFDAHKGRSTEPSLDKQILHAHDQEDRWGEYTQVFCNRETIPIRNAFARLSWSDLVDGIRAAEYIKAVLDGHRRKSILMPFIVDSIAP